IGFIAITYCIYCCSCKSGWSNLRRRIVYRQLARDEEQISEEREASRAQIRDSLAPGKQTRDDIRQKYQL
ncbi:unnamed protein product, partial [Adineta steineri]